MSKMIQIRNVPDTLHRALRARAAIAGMTLSDYLRAELEQSIDRLPASELRPRLALELFARFPITRYSHEPLLPRIWILRENLTAYDAAYVALSEGLRATLVTRDSRLADAPGHRAEVEVI